MSPQGLSLSLDPGACGQCLSPPVAPCGLFFSNHSMFLFPWTYTISINSMLDIKRLQTDVPHCTRPSPGMKRKKVQPSEFTHSVYPYRTWSTLMHISVLSIITLQIIPLHQTLSPSNQIKLCHDESYHPIIIKAIILHTTLHPECAGMCLRNINIHLVYVSVPHSAHNGTSLHYTGGGGGVHKNK